VNDGLVCGEVGGTRRIDPARGEGVSGVAEFAGEVAPKCPLVAKKKSLGFGPRLEAAEVDCVGRERMNLDALFAAARRRLYAFINRSIAQKLRRLREREGT
jgi:hypothetical protein